MSVFCEARVCDAEGSVLTRVAYRTDGGYSDVYRGPDVAYIREKIANEAWQSYTLKRLCEADCGFATRLILDEDGEVTELPLPQFGNERFDFGLLRHVSESDLMRQIESLRAEIKERDDRLESIRDLIGY